MAIREGLRRWDARHFDSRECRSSRGANKVCSYCNEGASWTEFTPRGPRALCARHAVRKTQRVGRAPHSTSTWLGDLSALVAVAAIGQIGGATADLHPAWPDIDLSSTAWMSQAACPNHQEIDFFGGSRGVTVCSGCVVRDACLDYALEHHIVDGVWGGTTGEDRKAMLRPVPATAVVYFAADDDMSFIKIGTSIELTKRLRTLGLHLLATEPGSFQREAELHRRFAHLRLAGERFRPDGDLLAYVDALLGRTTEVAA